MHQNVTPFAGVWIEIPTVCPACAQSIVTPFAGVWIEIEVEEVMEKVEESLPSRECGLK